MKTHILIFYNKLLGEVVIIQDVVSDSDAVMHAKVMLTKSFGINTITKQPWTPFSNARVVKENKAMTQEI